MYCRAHKTATLTPIQHTVGGPEPPRNLADQLTLFKPVGQIVPLTLLPAPPD